METAIIIVLAFMLLIAVIILIDINYDIKALNIKNQSCAVALDKSKKEKLETKYKSAHDEIFQRDERIKHLNYQINKYDKCNKQIAQDLKLKNNVIEDAWSVIRKLEKEKDKAINQSQSAMKLCNEMANKFEDINSELKAIELQLLGKLNP